VTRAAKTVYALAAVIGLATGITLGLLSERFSANLAEFQRLGAVAEYGDRAYIQYLHADVAHAKQALLSFISFLEQTERVSPSKSQEFDLALSYTRLALLEDAQSHSERSREYMEKALRWENSGGGRQRSADELKAAVQKLDSHLQQQHR
jgi:hypothetical protein